MRLNCAFQPPATLWFHFAGIGLIRLICVCGNLNAIRLSLLSTYCSREVRSVMRSMSEMALRKVIS